LKGPLWEVHKPFAADDHVGQISRQARVIGDVEEALNAVLLKHELTLAEEFLGEAIEENLLDGLARSSQASKLDSGEMIRYSYQHLRWESEKV
jgi:hypothetical protein